ncbi:Tetratricopeptide repeat-containing protein [Gloeomargarita lithophora Alchichica-D10]|uniref:Tetratricopeptide repeat-containing protein n=1 Tax=Gloeomargarita lithophora Alchichica-D10 TaxID=1188229 RepID=A0A1J0ADX6_9CYAN|nr:glycosyltransferase [Gloeomargarita lithophora]APB34141.1 Tetratricopeptide repeat-containing protein [Gloeomargarita lithophora Alchichica-D10]
MTVPISLCMIVRDEATALPRCLASVRGLVAELILVDTGSTDNTVAIAQAQGATVASFTWQDDFAAARNYSLELAHGEWILVLDADEVLVSAAIPLIQEAVTHPDLLAVNLLRQELGSRQTPYSLVSRLFRNRQDIRFQRAYHELIDDSITQIRQQEPHWRVGTIQPVVLQHWGYSEAMIQTKDKHTRIRRILTQALARDPQDAYLCAKLGATHLAQGELAQALTLLKRALTAHPPEPMVQYEIHFHLGLLYGMKQQWEAAQTHYTQAIATPCPAIVKLGAYTNLGSLYKEQGALTPARTLFEQTLQIDPTWATGHYNLGLTLKALNLLPAAVQAYQKAIHLEPTMAAAHQNLGVVLCKLGDVITAQDHWQKAIALYQQQGSPEGKKLHQELRILGLLGR